MSPGLPGLLPVCHCVPVETSGRAYSGLAWAAPRSFLESLSKPEEQVQGADLSEQPNTSPVATACLARMGGAAEGNGVAEANGSSPAQPAQPPAKWYHINKQFMPIKLIYLCCHACKYRAICVSVYVVVTTVKRNVQRLHAIELQRRELTFRSCSQAIDPKPQVYLPERAGLITNTQETWIPRQAK